MFEFDFMTKATILQKLEAEHLAVVDYVTGLGQVDFEAAPEGEWTAGQQIEHLYLSIKALTQAVGMPKMALSAVFGKADRPSNLYDEVVEDYENALKKGGEAPVDFCPEIIPFAAKEKTLTRLKETALRLCQALQNFSENDLDHYTVPHPLMGTMTLREMLFFTIFHVEYHHQSIQRNLS